MTWSVHIRCPFDRILWYEWDTKQEAHDFVKTLAIVMDTQIVADVMPTEMLGAMQLFDA